MQQRIRCHPKPKPYKNNETAESCSSETKTPKPQNPEGKYFENVYEKNRFKPYFLLYAKILFQELDVYPALFFGDGSISSCYLPSSVMSPNSMDGILVFLVVLAYGEKA